MENMMFPLLSSLVTGGAGLLSSIFSSSTSASNTQAQIAAQQQMLGQTEQFNAGQAQVQRDYETQMSNSAYTRASADMKNAGLNPAMMFSSGGPSSTPSVGAASVGTPNVPMPQKTSPFAGLGESVKSAISSMVDAKTIDVLTQKVANLQADQQLTVSQKAKTDQDTLKQMQNITSDLPKEKQGQQLGGFLARHPDMVTAAEATRYGAGVIGDVGSDAGAAAGGLFKSLWNKRAPGAAEDLSVGFSNSARSQMQKTYTLPAARQRMKELEDSFRSGSGGE